MNHDNIFHPMHNFNKVSLFPFLLRLFSEEKGTWQDNFFDILPGVSKYIQFKTDAKVVSKINFKTLNQFIQH